MMKNIKNFLSAFICVIIVLGFVLQMIPFAKAATLVWPVPGHKQLSQGFHNGNAIDISDSSIYGATIVAAMSGTVSHVYSCPENHSNYHTCSGFGTGVVINGDDGRIYQYAHMKGYSIPSNIYVGAYVTAGTKIGEVGNTGWSTGAHLHFGISLGKYWNESGINPQYETYVDSSIKPTVSIDNPVVPVCEDATFSFSNIYGNSLHLYIYKGTDKYFEGEFTPTQTYTRQFYEAGHYSCFIIAHTSSGDVESDWLGFDIVDKYTITFNANGGSGAPSPQTKVHGQTLTLSSTKPIRSGYTFLGWSTSSTETKATYVSSGSFTANANTTLYAVWQKNHAHSYTGTVTKVPTCTQPGVRTYKCSCGASYTQSIPSTGHTKSEWIIDVAGTGNSAGSKHKECTKCGAVLETTVIPQLKPVTPEITSVTNITSGVKFTWSETEGADSYIVYRRAYNTKTKKWGSWTRIADDVTATSYVDKTAKSGYYRYTVRAVNEGGTSGYDANGLKTYFLATPKVTSTANTNSAITVKWGKVAGATGYIVYRKTGNGKWQNLGKTTGTSFTDKTAKAGVTYRYTVRAYYGSYLSSFVANGYAVRRLTTPTLKSVTSSKSGVTFTWNKVAGATGYNVYRKTGNGGWQKIATVKGTSTVKYLDKTAKKGVTYKYTVRAYYGTSTSYYNTKGLTIKDKY